MRWYNINSSIRLPSDWISQSELNKSIVGEGDEVVSQVLIEHVLLYEKRWVFLKPHLFEPVPSGFLGHGEREKENVVAQTSPILHNHSFPLLISSSCSILVELCGWGGLLVFALGGRVVKLLYAECLDHKEWTGCPFENREQHSVICRAHGMFFHYCCYAPLYLQQKT